MADLARVARVTRRGDLPDVSAGELPANAYILHQEVMERAQRAHAPIEEHEGVRYYRWTGSLKSVMRSFWKGIPLGDEMPAPVSTAVSALYRYLNRTDNARCINAKKGGSIWLIRTMWNDRQPLEVILPHATAAASRRLTGAAAERARREAKLTEHEAGEDRAPAEVALEYQCTWIGADGVRCTRRFHSTNRRTNHIFIEHRPAESWIREALRTIALVPSPPSVLWDHAQELGYPASLGQLTKLLAELALDPGSEVVNATKPPRKEPTYVLRSRLGEVPQVIGPYCREPSCGRGPFETAYFRADHEKKEHPDSVYRVWLCLLGDGDGEKFYDWSSLKTHWHRAHAFVLANPRYETEKRKAEDRAEALRAKLPPTPAPEVELQPVPLPEPPVAVIEEVVVPAPPVPTPLEAMPLPRALVPNSPAQPIGGRYPVQASTARTTPRLAVTVPTRRRPGLPTTPIPPMVPQSGFEPAVPEAPADAVDYLRAVITENERLKELVGDADAVRTERDELRSRVTKLEQDLAKARKALRAYLDE